MFDKPILVVDDEPIVRETIRDWLINVGYESVTAESGEQALRMIAYQDFGVIVLDLKLPEKSGLEVLKKIKAAKPQIKSVIISVYSLSELAVEAMNLDTVDYLVKSVESDDLETLILKTLTEV